MKKKILLVFTLAFIVACNGVIGTPTTVLTEMPTATATHPPMATSSPTESPKTVAPTKTQTPEPVGFVEVRLHPYNGELPGQLTTQAKKALAQGLMPVVEFDASW